MTEQAYITERKHWISKLLSIRHPRFFPRCVRYRIRRLAQLEYYYNGTDEDNAFETLYRQFMETK